LTDRQFCIDDLEEEAMKINADLTTRASENTGQLPWKWSPDGSVERRMLDRDGDEIARATSIVRYPPGSRFPPHVHGGGEEFLVLEGAFADEHGAYPAGTYVRNPPGSRHAPFSADGCTIFVKLWQFDPSDSERKVIDTRSGGRPIRDRSGTLELELHRFGQERVSVLSTAEEFDLGDCAFAGGAEILVLEGRLNEGPDRLGPGSWLRLPTATRGRLTAAAGTRIYLKTGHLPGARPG
jgi:quercetin dioxygenase-like cupin family protein